MVLSQVHSTVDTTCCPKAVNMRMYTALRLTFAVIDNNLAS